MQCRAPEDLGIYVDDPPRIVLRDAPAILEAVPGITRFRIMVDGTEPGIDEDQRWKPRDLEALVELLIKLGRDDIDRTIVFWAAATDDAVRDAERVLPDLVDACDADAVEGDFEGAGGWRTKGIGYRALKRYAEKLDDALAWARMRGLRIEGSTFPGHIELTEHATFMPRCDVVNVQTYPVAWVKRRGKRRVCSWDGPLGPHRRVTNGLEKALEVLPDHVAITSALAAWRQRWLDPHRSALDTMSASYTAWEGVRAANPERVLDVVSYWAWKWLLRLADPENPYAVEFLDLLAGPTSGTH